ncbi:ABC transporter type 1, transmembrane domain-containing protein [Powellomyces hirtus]|nr:ABC transporter type 1, transmembrane domain-containing protein [Powellomyces hirtus]
MYLKTSRETKRLESVTRSPLYSQFSETMTGVTTIRAFGAEERLLSQQSNKVDANHRAYFLLWAAKRWLGLRTDIIGVMITLAAGVAVVVGDIGAGAGLAITYALNLSESLSWAVRMHAEMEMSMNSVERVLEYTKIEQEPAAIVEENRPAVNWPQKAKVKVRDLVIKYSTEPPAILTNLNITIEGGHKKDLHQERYLCSEEDDAGSGNTITPAGLAAAASTDTLDTSVPVTAVLDMPVSENGANFSQRQRQLLCLACAFLRRTMFIMLDEATASVDVATDAKIEQTMRTVAEYGTPLELAHIEGGVFNSMVNETGEASKLLEFARVPGTAAEWTEASLQILLRLFPPNVLSAFAGRTFLYGLDLI